MDDVADRYIEHLNVNVGDTICVSVVCPMSLRSHPLGATCGACHYEQLFGKILLVKEVKQHYFDQHPPCRPVAPEVIEVRVDHGTCSNVWLKIWQRYQNVKQGGIALVKMEKENGRALHVHSKSVNQGNPHGPSTFVARAVIQLHLKWDHALSHHVDSTT